MEYPELIIETYFHATRIWMTINNRISNREDGSAVEWSDGTKQWWINGKLHRLDGPAVEWINGTKAGWVNGKKVTRSDREGVLHNETTKLGEITQFIDFVARSDILLL